MPRISNTHAALADEFSDYQAFLAADLSDLDVASLWTAGTGLGAHIRALNKAGRDVMTPELEPDMAAQLETLMAIHTAFILGFSEANELQGRIAQAQAEARADPDLPVQTQSALSSMAKTPHLLADKALRLVNSLVRATATAPDAALDLLTGRIETARSSLIAFMRGVHPFVEVAEVAGAVSFVTAFLSGEQADVMQAAAIYLHDHIPAIVTLFSHEPQIIDWLGWMVRKLQREA